MKIIKTKIFCDNAELKVIKRFNKKNIIKGFTTNPTLMKKAGAKDDGTGAIYHFFKDLVNGKMKIDGNEHIPFSLFISS